MSRFAPPTRAPDKTVHRPARVVQARAPVRPARMSPTAATGIGLPGRLKADIEALSGVAMDDVRVHRQSPEPARFGALAFTRGSDIHLGSGQERHLPHEAWHVVQQKQGRVRATAHMKGWALNEDEALEVEADRMGAAAARGASTPAVVQRVAFTSPPAVIQRMVRACGKWLDSTWLQLSEPVSATLVKFIDAKERYVLRTDYCDKKLDEHPHILDCTKKYILGEAHNASLWDDEVRCWDVDTMVEWNPSIPPVQGDHGGRFKEEPFIKKAPERAPVREDQPLESAHARLLFEAIAINDYINDLTLPEMMTGWKQKDQLQLLHSRLREAKAHTWFTMFVIGPKYSKFAARYEKAFSGSKKTSAPSVEMKKIYAFSQRMGKVYSESWWALLTLLRGLEAVSGSKEEEAETTVSSEVPTVEGGLSRLAAARAFLPVLAKEVMSLVAVEDEFEADLLKAAMVHSGRTAEDNILAITNSARERAMIANIKSAEAPLLVKLGELHAKRVADGVGAEAIRVPWVQGERTLEKFTEQPNEFTKQPK